METVLTDPADPNRPHYLTSGRTLPLKSKPAKDALALWLSLAGSDAIPARGAFRPALLAAHLQHIYVAERLPELTPRYRYRLVGTSIVAAQGRESTGLSPEDVWPEGTAQQIIALYDLVCDLKEPVVVHGQATYWDKGWVDYESLMLPFSAEGQPVGQILGLIIPELD